MTQEEADKLRHDIGALGVPFVLIIGDTAASFFPGEDENDNVQAGTYARTLRTFTEVSGNPAVVALSHPVKNPSKDNLLPRGGGAFLNELDGNLTLWSERLGELTTLHFQGKLRGPPFSAIPYKLRSVPTGFTDKRGRPDNTIIAEPIDDAEAARRSAQERANEDTVLNALDRHPDWSLANIAQFAGWTKDGTPEKWRVQRAIDVLAKDKLVTQPRRGDKWVLTDKGKAAIQRP